MCDHYDGPDFGRESCWSIALVQSSLPNGFRLARPRSVRRDGELPCRSWQGKAATRWNARHLLAPAPLAFRTPRCALLRPNWSSSATRWFTRPRRLGFGIWPMGNFCPGDTSLEQGIERQINSLLDSVGCDRPGFRLVGDRQRLRPSAAAGPRARGSGGGGEYLGGASGILPARWFASLSMFLPRFAGSARVGGAIRRRDCQRLARALGAARGCAGRADGCDLSRIVCHRGQNAQPGCGRRPLCDHGDSRAARSPAGISA